jgi:hypothetical protein
VHNWQIADETKHRVNITETSMTNLENEALHHAKLYHCSREVRDTGHAEEPESARDKEQGTKLLGKR